VPTCDPEICSLRSGLNQNFKGVVVTLVKSASSPETITSSETVPSSEIAVA
jgi:hypothetical protein